MAEKVFMFMYIGCLCLQYYPHAAAEPLSNVLGVELVEAADGRCSTFVVPYSWRVMETK